MRDFSQLLDALVYTRSRTAKLKLIGDYLKRTPDPDRGYALAALTGELDLPAVKPAAIRAIAEERVDPVLLYMSRDYVGDMAETVSLLWPKPDGAGGDLDDGTLRLAYVVERLASLGRAEAPGALAHMLDHLDASGRFALLKLATGSLRIGVSARLAKVALAQAFDLAVDAVEEVWHGIGPPYLPIFAWAEGRGTQPTAEDVRAVKEAEKNGIRESLRENGYWQASLMTMHLLGRDPRQIPQRIARADGLDQENIHAAIRKYFDPQRHTIVTLMPEEAGSGQPLD